MTASGFAGLLAGLLAAVLFGVAAVVQARAVRRQGDLPRRVAAFWRASVTDPMTMLVVGAYLAGFVLHAVAILLLPLYVAQASIALSFPITAWLSRNLDHTSGRRRLTAVVAITAGLALLALTSGEPGDAVIGWGFAGFLLLGVLALGLLGRTGTAWSGAVLGGLAGLGYAGSAIAVRGITTEFSAPVLLAAVCVPAYGLIAFWLYSLSMHSDDIAPATGSLIVLQTLVPSVVGVSLLRDALPAQGALAAVVGVLLALGGVQALSQTGPTAPVS